MKAKRVILIVLDSVGIGHAPDAADFGDEGSHTLKHINDNISEFRIPNLLKMGLGKIQDSGLPHSVDLSIASYGRATETSLGKDTTTGHWEIAGLNIQTPFPTYPNGFPEELIKEFESRIGVTTIGNYSASGTAIISELGEEHMNSGCPIVYTSADSVFQIAAHEDIIPVEQLHEQCRIARELLKGEHAVGRVIARPFIGTPGNFSRTSNRKDFSLNPFESTVLNAIEGAGKTVYAIGKINDIFNGAGISTYVPTENNMDGVDKTIEAIQQDFDGLIFTNLVDFDMLFGHRRDVPGYANALEEFDGRLPEIINAMKSDDVLILTADHGNDPTAPGTDHTRERVPVLVYSKGDFTPEELGTRDSFADIAASIAELLSINYECHGKSFWAK